MSVYFLFSDYLAGSGISVTADTQRDDLGVFLDLASPGRARRPFDKLRAGSRNCQQGAGRYAG